MNRTERTNSNRGKSEAPPPDGDNGLSGLSQQELRETLSRFPSGQLLLTRFEEEIEGLEGNQRDDAIDQRLQALVGRISKYEEEIANRADVEAVLSRHLLAEFFSGDPIIRRLRAGIEYLVLCLEQMVNIHDLPPDSLDCLALRVLIEFKQALLISRMVDMFPEEQKSLVGFLLPAIYGWMETEMDNVAVEKGRWLTIDERKEFSERSLERVQKHLPSIAHALAPSEFEDYVNAAFPVEFVELEGPGRPPRYEQATERYLELWKEKHGKSPSTRPHIETELVSKVRDEEGAPWSEHEAYRKGIKRQLGRWFPKEREAGKVGGKKKTKTT
jgi:hypothetical protein